MTNMSDSRVEGSRYVFSFPKKHAGTFLLKTKLAFLWRSAYWNKHMWKHISRNLNEKLPKEKLPFLRSTAQLEKTPVGSIACET